MSGMVFNYGKLPLLCPKSIVPFRCKLYIAFSLLHGNNGLLSIKFLRVTLWHMSICARVVIA